MGQTKTVLEIQLETEVELYNYMVLKPLARVADLVRGEHHQAAGILLEGLQKEAAEFSLRLSALLEKKPEAEKPAEPAAAK